MSSLNTIRDRWEKAIFLISAAFFLIAGSFVYGYFVGRHKIFPYPVLKEMKDAANSLRKKYSFILSKSLKQKKHEKYPNLWFKATENKSGLQVNKSNRVQPGYTFFSDHTSSAYLIDIEGNVVHQWQKPFYEVWEIPKHIIDRVPENQIYWRKAHLLSNGDILAIYEGINQSPYGGGLIKLDKNSNLIWKVDINAHHDLDIAEDGRIFVLSHKYERIDHSARISDYITVISPDGQILESIPLFDAIKESIFSNMIRNNPVGDFLHTNNVELLTRHKAVNFPFFQPGDILLSHLSNSTITVMDGNTYRIKWLLSGISKWQHDPDFTENGSIVFFDNLGLQQPNYRLERLYSAIASLDYKALPKVGEVGSRVIEYDLKKNNVVWSYADMKNFFSINRGSQQKLENGNYLITESAAGTIFEITPNKEIVWKYVSFSLDGDSISVVNWATRYSRAYLQFLKN